MRSRTRSVSEVSERASRFLGLPAEFVALTTYGPPGGLKGTLGVVGPTRMQYAQIVGRLGAVARAASERMSEVSN